MRDLNSISICAIQGFCHFEIESELIIFSSGIERYIRNLEDLPS